MKARSNGLRGQFRADYISDPRTLLAQQLQQSGGSTAPVQSAGEGVARMLTAWGGGLQQGALKNEYQSKAKDYADALSEAYASDLGRSGRPAGVDPTTGAAIPAVSPGYAGVASALKAGKFSENPYVQDYATTLEEKAREMEEKRKAEFAGKGLVQDESGNLGALPGYGAGMGSIDADRAKATLPFDLAKAAASAARNQTNINNMSETEENKGIGKYRAERYGKAVDAADVAAQTKAQIGAAKKIPLEGGAFAPYTKKIDSIAKAFGIDTAGMGLENANNAEAFTQITNNIVLQKQLAQKGPQTESDAQRMEASMAQLGNTPAARMWGLDMAEKLADRDIKFAKFITQYKRENGSLEGAESAWYEGEGGQPLDIPNPEGYLKYNAKTSGAQPKSPAKSGWSMEIVD